MTARLAVSLSLMVSLIAIHTPAAPQNLGSSSAWLLDDGGKSTNSVASDPRLMALLKAGLPDVHATALPEMSLPEAAATYLGGAPELITVESQRYVTLAACIARDGYDRGLLWVDANESESGLIFAALSVDPSKTSSAELSFFTKTQRLASSLPPSFLTSVNRWLDKLNIHRLTKTTITGPGGRAVVLPGGIMGRP